MNMNSLNPKRRLFLRQAIALGCVLSVPAIISGCDGTQEPPSPQVDDNENVENESKDTNDRPGSPEPTGSPESNSSSTSDDQSESIQSTVKMSKVSASYQEQPNGDEKCANCQQFIAGNNTCKVVEGQISPEGWCKLWVKKV